MTSDGLRQYNENPGLDNAQFSVMFCPIIPAVLTGSSVNASCPVISVAANRYIVYLESNNIKCNTSI